MRGRFRYDIRFKARARYEDEETELIINVEAQNNFKPGYSLVTRGIYYCSRMISAQMETEFSHSDYAGMKKVHSIWVCIRPNKQWKGSITTYTIGESNILGNAKSDHDDYDKMQVTLLCPRWQTHWQGKRGGNVGCGARQWNAGGKKKSGSARNQV